MEMRPTGYRSAGILSLCAVELFELLPHLTAVVIASVDAAGPVVIARARARARASVSARCTGCGVTSGWVHSRYMRHLADVALGGWPVRIDLSVRRLYCENPTCPKADSTAAPTRTDENRHRGTAWTKAPGLRPCGGPGPLGNTTLQYPIVKRRCTNRGSSASSTKATAALRVTTWPTSARRSYSAWTRTRMSTWPR